MSDARRIRLNLEAMQVAEWVRVEELREETLGYQFWGDRWVIRTGDSDGTEYLPAFGETPSEALDDFAQLWTKASGRDFWQEYHETAGGPQ